MKELSLDAVDDLHQLADVEGWIATQSRVFYYCGDETTVVIPKTIKRIENNAFCENTTPKRIILSAYINYIGLNNGPWERFDDDEGFVTFSHTLYKYCGSASYVVVPSHITIIQPDAFSDLLPSQHVKLPDCLQEFKYNSNEKSFADSDGFIASKRVLFGYCGKSGFIMISEGIEYIRREAEEAFFSIRKHDLMIRTTVQLPSSFKSKWSNNWTVYADSDGFVVAGNRLIKYIGKEYETRIPNSVEEIDEWAFTSPTQLKRVIVPSHIKSFLVHIDPKVFVWESSP